jgi:hypothetical protein
MNEDTNNMLPSNQKTVKKSAKEDNKEYFSTPPSSKKKCKYKKRKIFKILKKFHKKIEKIVAKRKRMHYINGKHNKFAYDNMIRKLKVHLFESIKVILNESLREDEVENPKKNSKKRIVRGPFFVKINQEIIRETSVKKNFLLLDAKIKDIFMNVSKKYNKYNNEELIKKFINKETKTSKILKRSFLECLKHFRGSEKIEELAGLENGYNNVIDQLRNKGEKEENIEKFKKFVEGFEENIKLKNNPVVEKKIK